MTSQRTQRRIRSDSPSVTSTPAARSFPVLSELNSVFVSASKPNCRFNRPAFFAGLFFLPRVGADAVIFRICHAAQYCSVRLREPCRLTDSWSKQEKPVPPLTGLMLNLRHFPGFHCVPPWANFAAPLRGWI